MKKIYGLIILMLTLGGIANAQSENAVTGLRNTANHVELFTNPSTNEINIRVTNPKYKSVQFQLYNVVGNLQKSKVQEVKQGKVFAREDASKYKFYKLNTNNLASGYYLLVLKDPKTHFYKALQFQKISSQ
ncbi:hypothetical protein FUAX_34420 [Fulvitalea axinellae]|uniref:Secretion system C-terminal sorting domain-containing protein n=1 Tax=Fulvitalea axinellae TaxID=1182444 RepID=A0AAU9DET0_9BACT|nr:hypothetical protein FUAX_34420 [Fulvitalea axinellae]